MKKIETSNLENTVANEFLEYEDSNNAKELNERIIELIAEELSYYIDIDIIMKKLAASGAFEQLKIRKEDLKKIAVDNLIMEILEENKELIDESYNLMPLANINFNVIKEEDYSKLIYSLIPQVEKIISNPIHNKAKEIAESTLRDGIIMTRLIQNDKKHNTNKEINDEEKQNHYIDSIAKKITDKKLDDFLDFEIDSDETLKTGINYLANGEVITNDDVEDAIYSTSYRRVLRKVPDDEFLELILKSEFVKQKTK